MEYTVQKLLSPYIYNDIAECYSPDSFSNFKNKTVLITGAGQLAGYYLACAVLMGNDLDNNNTRVILCDPEENLFEKYGNLTHRRDIEFVVTKDFSNMPREKADFIIHTNVAPDMNYFEAMVNLLDYAQNSGANVLLCSDMKIYGEVFNGKDKLFEDDMGYVDLAKADSYEIQSQRMVEAYGKKLVKESDLNLKIARISSVLGALGMNSLNKLVTFSDKNALFYADDADITESYCYVTDMVTALVKILIDGNSGEAYNISANCNTSMKYITEACQKLLPDTNVAYKSKKNNHNSPMNSTHFILDNSKLLNLGFAPKICLEEAVKRIVTIIQNVK